MCVCLYGQCVCLVLCVLPVYWCLYIVHIYYVLVCTFGFLCECCTHVACWHINQTSWLKYSRWGGGSAVNPVIAGVSVCERELEAHDFDEQVVFVCTLMPAACSGC